MCSCDGSDKKICNGCQIHNIGNIGVNEYALTLSKIYGELHDLTLQCSVKNCGSCDTEAGCRIADRWSELDKQLEKEK